MKNPRIELITVLLMFVLVAAAGFLMRSFHWIDISPIKYHDLRNAHSHLAFLGWLFPVIMLLLERAYKTESATSYMDKIVFWAVIVVNLLMFYSFLQFGYGPPSVVLLSIHTILAVVYGVRFLNRLDEVKSNVNPLLAKLSMAMMMVSFLGPLSIPVIKNLGFGPTEMKLAIHFYLHFQYNGFFVLAVLALMMKYNSNYQSMRVPTGLFTIGMIGTYLLTVQWGVSDTLGMVGDVFGVVQVIGGLWLIKLMLPGLMSNFPEYNLAQKTVVITVITSLSLKMFLQSLTVVLPELAIDSGVHGWVIAFLHLVFLGVVTPYIMLELVAYGFVKLTRLSVIGYWLLIAGLFTTESILLWQGSMGMVSWLPFIPFNELLAFGSGVLLIASVLFCAFGFGTGGTKLIKP